MAADLTHLNARGEANMVDVGDKQITDRIAIAEGRVNMRPETLALIAGGDAPKGDVIATARLAGIMAAKKTAELIPLCHPLMLNRVAIDIAPVPGEPSLHIEATVRVSGKTGVEMEALTAVSVACLTIYDMIKAVDRGVTITDIGLASKSGGKSGDWRRDG